MTTDFEDEQKDLAKAGLRTSLKLQSPMEKDVKSRWLTALRSGEYKQGQGWLRQDDHDRKETAAEGLCHCCLGVLLEAEGESGWSYRDDYSPVYELLGSRVDMPAVDSFLTDRMLEKVGLGQQSMMALSRANDRRGLSFEDIADAIEECL